ncbi:MAG: NAD(P) transhydrogenase subunit alpha [Rickettsiaceae bacterium]|nr:MAG: NAD(P) transhydrogenase subunit alpha [Rickettsiaceae bacterium]
MKIAALKERAPYENRTAITPETVKLYIKKGFSVSIEQDLGLAAGFIDDEYLTAGATISNVVAEVLLNADIILKVQPTPLIDQDNEIDLAKRGTVIIGLLSPYQNSAYIERLLDKGLSGIAMERMPRITKAQNMDVLSSQSNLAGYRASIEAMYHYNRAIPMMMTAAGTITPAKVLVMGVGVAGLQAIATMKRMGAVVSGYDVRNSTKEQVQSLGAKFISPDNIDMEESSGYAKESSVEDKQKQQQLLITTCKNYDIIITTALIPGKQAPRLIDKNIIELLKPGTIIVDMAVGSGGNVEGSKIDEIVVINNIKIIGWSNLASKVAKDSSQLYAKNLYNFLSHAILDGNINMNDDLVKSTLLTNNQK